MIFFAFDSRIGVLACVTEWASGLGYLEHVMPEHEFE